MHSIHRFYERSRSRYRNQPGRPIQQFKQALLSFSTAHDNLVRAWPTFPGAVRSGAPELALRVLDTCDDLLKQLNAVMGEDRYFSAEDPDAFMAEIVRGLARACKDLKNRVPHGRSSKLLRTYNRIDKCAVEFTYFCPMDRRWLPEVEHVKLHAILADLHKLAEDRDPNVTVVQIFTQLRQRKTLFDDAVEQAEKDGKYERNKLDRAAKAVVDATFSLYANGFHHRKVVLNRYELWNLNRQFGAHADQVWGDLASGLNGDGISRKDEYRRVLGIGHNLIQFVNANVRHAILVSYRADYERLDFACIRLQDLLKNGPEPGEREPGAPLVRRSQAEVARFEGEEPGQPITNFMHAFD